jgi:DNA-directed RNA polymerase subunit RPC12/RpoP
MALQPRGFRRRIHDRLTDAPGELAPGDLDLVADRCIEPEALAHGFARARCGQCGHDFLSAFSCKGRGVCPSCNARRMVETAAHLTDRVVPSLPLRQWVLSVPKRLRYFLERDAELQGTALQLFLRVVEQCLRAHSPGSGPAARLARSPSSTASAPPYGSLRQRPLPGEEAHGARPHRASDGPAICEAIREDEQERPQRRRGDL